MSILNINRSENLENMIDGQPRNVSDQESSEAYKMTCWDYLEALEELHEEYEQSNADDETQIIEGGLADDDHDRINRGQ